MTSWWARWRLRSPASHLFTRPFKLVQRNHQSSASLAFVRGSHRWPVNSPQRASNAENVSIWRHHEWWICVSVISPPIWDILIAHYRGALLQKVVMIFLSGLSSQLSVLTSKLYHGLSFNFNEMWQWIILHVPNKIWMISRRSIWYFYARAIIDDKFHSQKIVGFVLTLVCKLQLDERYYHLRSKCTSGLIYNHKKLFSLS